MEELSELPDDKRIVSMLDKKSDQKVFLATIKRISEGSHAIMTFSEITNIVIEKREYQIKAFHDELTKIANRAKFNQKLDDEMALFQHHHE